MDIFLSLCLVYYVPISFLLVFLFIVIKDCLLLRREKRYFVTCILLVLVLMLATASDNVLRIHDGNELVFLRRITSAIQYGLAPGIPLSMLLIYEAGQNIRVNRLHFILAGVNLVISFLSMFTGWVFYISDQNAYTKGPLHMLPFVICGLYYLASILYSLKESANSRRYERYTLIICFVIIGISYYLEVGKGLSHVVWPATLFSLAIYYMVRAIGASQYDGLTGAKNRRLYDDFIKNVNHRDKVTFAVIDLNNLKLINDTLGHSAGDKAIISISKSLIGIKIKKHNVFRYGGDEFVVSCPGHIKSELSTQLETVRQSLGYVNDIRISFAFSVGEYSPEEDAIDFMSALDAQMYRDKSRSKRSVF